MPKYKVVATVKHNKKVYGPGKTIDMPEDEAELLITRGVLKGDDETDVNPTGMQPAAVVPNDPKSKKVDVSNPQTPDTSNQGGSADPTELPADPVNDPSTDPPANPTEA